MRAGVTGRDLTAPRWQCAAARPWMSHFYLGHGLGLDSAEMPFVGSDSAMRSTKASSSAGMVLVLEPIVWDEGQAATARKTSTSSPMTGGST